MANRLFGPDNDSVARIHDQLANLAKIRSGTLFAVPAPQLLTREQLSALIETAFWAGLQFNEGRTTRVCISVGAPENAHDIIKFKTPVDYDESQIAKLAPAVPRGGCLVVFGSSDGLNIWGFGRSRPGPWVDTVTIELSEPGTLRIGVGPFRSFAVLNGRSDSVIASAGLDLAHHLQRALQKNLPGDDLLEQQAVWRECLALADLARTILADAHGGTVLIVPNETGAWEGTLDPFAYRFAVPDTTIRDVIRQELKDAKAQGEMLQQLSQAAVPDELKTLVASLPIAPTWGGMTRGVRAIASLAGVDGAIVITQDLRVLGFGAKISVQGDAAPVCMFRPQPGSQSVVPSPLEHLGGTRHQSAARFAATNKDAVALVISQDGHVSVMHWDDAIEAVAVIRNVERWI